MFIDYDEKDFEINEYEFIFEEPDNGWWLKIDSVEKLIDYHKKTTNLYSGVITDYTHNKKYHWTNKRTLPIVMYAQKHHLTIIDAIIQFRLLIAQQQLEQIHKYKAIYINSSGGYHSNAKYKQFVFKKELVFPDCDKKDIKIEQFPGGTHFYAYIGNMQLRDGDKLKWDTYQEAYEYAKKFV